jgi:carbon starvation protein CstA
VTPAGTNSGYLCESKGEFLGKIWKPWGDLNRLPASLLATGLVVFGWGYFIYTGSVDAIWPMLGMANRCWQSEQRDVES